MKKTQQQKITYFRKFPFENKNAPYEIFFRESDILIKMFYINHANANDTWYWPDETNSPEIFKRE